MTEKEILNKLKFELKHDRTDDFITKNFDINTRRNYNKIKLEIKSFEVCERVEKAFNLTHSFFPKIKGSHLIFDFIKNEELDTLIYSGSIGYDNFIDNKNSIDKIVKQLIDNLKLKVI
ncbi:hypothetical protein [Staphylococcus chromogenes]|uniref:hypothetical protein n=1 Tax=Staphylococcus chromogenes TaxID=46126 RepID=UPI0028889F20|nr:hypothetical protein [Staphylococcus chromogenes]MDT0700414.1 hypothetical protein [Staphylococcus chromogenes]